jgi:hypothetical protein
VTPTTVQAPSRHATEFYKRVINVFQDNSVEFLVGGAYAFVHYTGIGRDTKDLDLFIRRVDWDRAARALEDVGISAELTFPHWLGKAFGGRQREFFVDLIFSGGNGVAEVDDEWFSNAQWDESLGFPVRLMPIEEMLWSKAFIMERERYDGADVLHLVRARQMDINWPRLVTRFGEHWRVLLSHLVDGLASILPGLKNRPVDVPAFADRVGDRVCGEAQAGFQLLRAADGLDGVSAEILNVVVALDSPGVSAAAFSAKVDHLDPRMAEGIEAVLGAGADVVFFVHKVNLADSHLNARDFFNYFYQPPPFTARSQASSYALLPQQRSSGPELSLAL